jgi:hypothetical protein
MKHLLQLLFPVLLQPLAAQINGYAKITAISGNVLTLSNANQTYGSFVPGQKVLVIQMQGASINGYTANTSSFGNVSSLNAAGLYEVALITGVNGAVTSVTLSNNLSNTYDVNSSLQLITYPQLGTSAFTTTANLTALAWNGTIGGVVAFYVNGNLNLNHNVTADNDGFRGGTKAGQDGSVCENSVYRTTAGSTKYANKGEGVYITAAGEKSGIAKAANGGGGAIVHNGGGGGGGNFTAGGDGYFGYSPEGCSSGSSAGGQGGTSLSLDVTRIFMGGGGGGGQENNALGTNGANGGGLVMIKCDTLVVGGTCGSRIISANGGTASDSGNDGAGGGGAGGTVLLNIKGVRASCPFTISANGGGGGSVSNSASHGAGGGGGQGALYITANAPFSNTTLQTNIGAGGKSNNTASAPTAGSGVGPSGAGINTGAGANPLPVEISLVKAEEVAVREIEVSWKTETEVNNKYFEVQYSTGEQGWVPIGYISGAGTSDKAHYYKLLHREPVIGTNYYRVKQVDNSGQEKLSQVVYSVLEDSKIQVKVYPNPAEDKVILESDQDISAQQIFVRNTMGKKISVAIAPIDRNRFEIDLTGLSSGIYIISSQNIFQKVILK